LKLIPISIALMLLVTSTISMNEACTKSYINKLSKFFSYESVFYSNLDETEKSLIRYIATGEGEIYNQLVRVPPSFASNEMVAFEFDHYKIEILTTEFDARRHVIDSCHEKLLEINGRVKLGVKFKAPSHEISEFNVEYGKNTITVNAREWNNLYDPDLFLNPQGMHCCTRAYCNNDNGNFYICINGGSGWSFYSATFVFNDNKFIGRYFYNP